MDQQQGADVVRNAAANVENTVSDLAAKTEKIAQDKLDQSKPVLREVREFAGTAMDQASELARKASSAGAQAVDAIQGAARDVGNQASQSAAAVYQQGVRAGGSVSRYTAEQPLTALLIAGVIGYGLAYLIHRD